VLAYTSTPPFCDSGHNLKRCNMLEGSFEAFVEEHVLPRQAQKRADAAQRINPMKKYLRDGEEVDANDLIRHASDLDDQFRRDWLKTTSRAAEILREHGHTVEVNPKFGTEATPCGGETGFTL
jgi:hypothetical protein